MANKLLIVAVLLAGLAYVFYQPIPEGYSLTSSLKLRGFFVLPKLGYYMGLFAGKLGICTTIDIMKKFTIEETSSVNMTVFNLQATDELFDGVLVRVYTPINHKEPLLPGFVYYHGGGWAALNVNAYDKVVAPLAQAINAVVVSVEYRLAPEHVFPAAHDDCVKATKYFIENAKKYHVDATRIAIGGDSAGGNLAATVALRLRDDQFEPKVKLQVLIYPVVQGADLMLPSYQTNANDVILRQDLMATFHALYISSAEHINTFAANRHVPNSVRRELAETHLNINRLPKKYTKNYVRPEIQNEDLKLWADIESNMFNPYFSPLFADNLASLPPAYIFSCEHDVLRDEAYLFAHRLREAGIKVEHYMFESGFHGIMSLTEYFPEMQAAIKNMYDFIKKNL